MVSDFTEVEYASAVITIEALTGNLEQTRRRTREVAERLFDVRRVGFERYSRLYEKVLGSTN